MLRIFWATGGMPSSYSAVVTALATSIAFVEGLGSPLFILAFFYAFIGRETAIIDHHESTPPEDVLVSDIRTDYGACSSIIFSYFRELDQLIPSSVSTALLVGLLADTALMTRRVSRADIEAYTTLYDTSDIRLVNSIPRNKLRQEDLVFYRQAIDRVRIQDRFAFCYLDEGCDVSLLGIIGDFFKRPAQSGC